MMKKKTKINFLAFLLVVLFLGWHNAQLAEQACLDLGNSQSECEKVWW
ncbi:MAG: hypothetical protein R3309_11270 [Reinekea sp.]|nr:hypothetical protein [Reinekea sp.]